MIWTFLNSEVIGVDFYSNVTNISEIIEESKKTSDVCFLDSSKIYNEFILFLAIQKSLLNRTSSIMKTKCFKNEIMFSLSPNKNISFAIDTFGIKQCTTSIIVVHLSTSAQVNVNGKKDEMFSSIKDDSFFKNIYGIEHNKVPLEESIILRINSK